MRACVCLCVCACVACVCAFVCVLCICVPTVLINWLHYFARGWFPAAAVALKGRWRMGLLVCNSTARCGIGMLPNQHFKNHVFVVCAACASEQGEPSVFIWTFPPPASEWEHYFTDIYTFHARYCSVLRCKDFLLACANLTPLISCAQMQQLQMHITLIFN